MNHCGGSEASITSMGVRGYAAMKALSTSKSEPERVSRTFEAESEGFVIGEGSGILVLESLEYAERRGAKILAEVAGYGMSGDAHHITAPAENGDGAYRVMRATIRYAKIEPQQIDYFNAHGTSTPLGHAIGSHALKR